MSPAFSSGTFHHPPHWSKPTRLGAQVCIWLYRRGRCQHTSVCAQLPAMLKETQLKCVCERQLFCVVIGKVLMHQIDVNFSSEQSVATFVFFFSRKDLSNVLNLGSWGEENKAVIKTEYGNPPSWEQLEGGRLIGKSLCCSFSSPGIKKKLAGCGRGHRAEEPQRLLFAEAVQGRNACYPKVCPVRKRYVEGWSSTHSSQDPPFSSSFWLCPCPCSLANQC